MMSQHNATPTRRAPSRTHSNFLARTASDSAAQLARRSSIIQPSPSPREAGEEDPLLGYGADGAGGSPSGPLDQLREVSSQAIHRASDFVASSIRQITISGGGGGGDATHGGAQVAFEPSGGIVGKNRHTKAKSGAYPRPAGGGSKLGTFAGVFVPTSLNVLSILMFLRFGFILGQSGVLGMMGMLIACYAINLLTTLSISAIATNGTVRGGGAYYLISRSLGPEFGGSIGIVFYLGFVFNTGMNAVGLIDCIIENFGSKSGTWSQWMPEGFWWQYLWATIVLVVCTAICLAGSGLFARASNGLLVILLIATFSIPLSTFMQNPFVNSKAGIEYTGLRIHTFMDNLMPRFTKGAAGSQIKGRETFQDLFGILFPATGGIFAGASMSGDLKHPSKAIPKGTLYGLLLTFVSYTVVILAMGASITRASFYNNTNVIQVVNVSGVIILLGEFATSFFSSLMGVIGSAKLLQALARDNLLPGLSIFGQGTKQNDEPIYAIILTYVVAQLTMLSDINRIASFVTMTYLMTFLVTNLACFLLKIGSAPNFRPSFRYFNWETAAVGTIVSGATMFFVDGLYASGCVVILIAIFAIIHYTTPPKPWGDVSQSLIYHQVRKYLLRLRQEHVKFWRPQILLLINDPRRQYKLIQFCNSLKKGSLYILAHVITSEDFGAAVPEARHQQTAWTKYIDFSKIKAFVNVVISPAIEWGARNAVLSAGLGGMRPNIVVMGAYNLPELRLSNPSLEVPSAQSSRPPSSAAEEIGQKDLRAATIKKRAKSMELKMSGKLPTDLIRREGAISPQSYVTILEDLLLRLRINVAIGKGFKDLELPASKPSGAKRTLSYMGLLSTEEEEESNKKYIDLWPIQMSAEIAEETVGDDRKRNMLTTNFDTYTLILQLGCILNTVPSWKRTYKLRVIVFVEYESDVEEERGRVKTLLTNLRIQADVLVFWLASGDLKTYEVIVNGNSDKENSEAILDVDRTLADEEWWHELRHLRGSKLSTEDQVISQMSELLGSATNWPGTSFQHSRQEAKISRFEGLRRMLRRKKTKRKASVSNLSQLGVSLGMRTHRLPEGLTGGDDSSSASGSSSEFMSDSDAIGSTSDDDMAASENDADMSDSDDDRPTTPIRRAKSTGASAAHPFVSARTRAQQRRTEASSLSSSGVRSTVIRPGAATSDPTLLGTSASSKLSSGSSTRRKRPFAMRQQSLPKFTSKTVPKTEISTNEDSGPSIMFTDVQSPDEPRTAKLGEPLGADGENVAQADGAAQRIVDVDTVGTSAKGFPAQQSVPLSFNDLPCRAQHLILNELMRNVSSDSAVMFTTLPCPVEGTCKSEIDSLRYLSELEILWQDLPPLLLVHSNSMTVTMNL